MLGEYPRHEGDHADEAHEGAEPARDGVHVQVEGPRLVGQGAANRRQGGLDGGADHEPDGLEQAQDGDVEAPLVGESGAGNVGPDGGLVGGAYAHQEPPKQHDPGPVPALVIIREKRETRIDNVPDNIEEAGYDAGHPDGAHPACQPAQGEGEQHLAYGVDGDHPPEQLHQLLVVEAG